MPSEQELIDLQDTLYSSGNPTRRWLHCSRRDWIHERIAACAHPVGTALEVGPGSGGYLPVLAAVAGEVIASDIEEAYLRAARERLSELPNLRCVQDDITVTALPAGQVDLLLCTEVIEHIADSQAALHGLHRLLAADGTVILTTPQRYSPLEVCAKVAFLPGVIQVVRWIYREPIIETGHINLLTRTQLEAQLERAGFAIEQHYTLGFYLPLIAEFTGEWGQRALQWLETRLRGTPLSWLLWTQCYVLRKQ